MKLKTKLTLGIGFLFIIILVFGVLSIVSINILKSDSAKVLSNNHETLMYCNNILKALDEVKSNKRAIDSIEVNLSRQENNITEPGEKEATDLLRKNFEELKANPNDSSYTSSLFAKGINKISQKVGEEAVELVIESKDDNQEKFLNEAADLLYHYLVLLQAKKYRLDDVVKILMERHK